MPDPHPGRCLNYRTKTHSDGYIESLRCLDYEGTEHVCSFPSSTHVTITGQWQSWAGAQVDSKPWVKP